MDKELFDKMYDDVVDALVPGDGDEKVDSAMILLVLGSVLSNTADVLGCSDRSTIELLIECFKERDNAKDNPETGGDEVPSVLAE